MQSFHFNLWNFYRSLRTRFSVMLWNSNKSCPESLFRNVTQCFTWWCDASSYSASRSPSVPTAQLLGRCSPRSFQARGDPSNCHKKVRRTAVVAASETSIWKFVVSYVAHYLLPCEFTGGIHFISASTMTVKTKFTARWFPSPACFWLGVGLLFQMAI